MTEDEMEDEKCVRTCLRSQAVVRRPVCVRVRMLGRPCSGVEIGRPRLGRRWRFGEPERSLPPRRGRQPFQWPPLALSQVRCSPLRLARLRLGGAWALFRVEPAAFPAARALPSSCYWCWRHQPCCFCRHLPCCCFPCRWHCCRCCPLCCSRGRAERQMTGARCPGPVYPPTRPPALAPFAGSSPCSRPLHPLLCAACELHVQLEESPRQCRMYCRLHSAVV